MNWSELIRGRKQHEDSDKWVSNGRLVGEMELRRNLLAQAVSSSWWS